MSHGSNKQAVRRVETENIEGVVQEGGDGHHYIVFFNKLNGDDLGYLRVDEMTEKNLEAYIPRLRPDERLTIRRQTKAVQDTAREFLAGKSMVNKLLPAHLRLEQYEFDRLAVIVQTPLDLLVQEEIERRLSQLYTRIKSRDGREIEMQWGNIQTLARWVRNVMEEKGGFATRPHTDVPTDKVPEVTLDPNDASA